MAVVPTFDNPRTIAGVVVALRRHFQTIIVVDDGSGPEGRAAIDALGAAELVTVVRLESNQGKGGAVQAGVIAARALGFSHALQVDADGQHDLEAVPLFLEAARASPASVILGRPVFDHTVPWGRLAGRQLTVCLTRLEVGGAQITDPMCGFRVYPLAAMLGLRCGRRMDFDIEVAVRLVWRGVSVVNLPTKVRYLQPTEGGVSHFRMLEDNARITWLHIRLLCQALGRALARPLRAFAP